jgi:hypothetical protein
MLNFCILKVPSSLGLLCQERAEQKFLSGETKYKLCLSQTPASLSISDLVKIGEKAGRDFFFSLLSQEVHGRERGSVPQKCPM